MNAISDPGRPSRGDRRRAQKLIDTAFSEGRLTAADRALRTQRIDAAHTRGDLAMITRDITAPTQANLGRALDPATVVRPTLPTLGGTPTLDLSGVGRRLRLFVLIAVGGMLASCVLGLLAFIPVFLTEAKRDVDSAPARTPETVSPAPRQSPTDVPDGDVAGLHTAAGWTNLVKAIEAESGTTQVYDLVAYPQYASVGLDGKGAVERRFYRDGAWQDSVSVRTPAAGSRLDLADIDPELIARLPAETAREVGIDQPTGTYLVINAFAGNPRIMVYVQSDGGSEYRAYRLDGTLIS